MPECAQRRGKFQKEPAPPAGKSRGFGRWREHRAAEGAILTRMSVGRVGEGAPGANGKFMKAGQFSSVTVVSDSLQLHGLQHARLP